MEGSSSITVENEFSGGGENGTSTGSHGQTPVASTSSRTRSEFRICPLPTISVEESPPIFVNSTEEKKSSEEGLSDYRGTSTGNSDDVQTKAVENKSDDTKVFEDDASQKSESKSSSVSLGLRDHNDGHEADNIVADDNELFSEFPAPARREYRTKSLGPSLRRRHRRSSRNFRRALSEEAKLNEIQAEDLEKRLKALAAAFSERTERTKKKIEQPPTPSSEESDSDDLKPGEPTLLDRLRQLASPESSEFGDGSSRRKSISQKIRGSFAKNLNYIYDASRCNYILDPQSSMYIGWLLIVASAFMYNAWVIPLRVVFPYQTESNELAWVIVDSIADVIYLIDVIAFKPHVKFIRNGFWVKEPMETMKTYIGSLQFKIDMISLLPADVVVNILYNHVPLLRVPRILKVDTFWELFRQLDTYLANPHRARVFHTCLYMLYMIHIVACSYYGMSLWEGIGKTTWTFDGHGNAYIRCFYFATKTATSIGKNPKPENELEYLFMTFAWLSGVFVTAILIGQIRDIIATATKSQTEYRILTSATVSYLHRLGVPRRLQDRVKLWLSYTWEQQKTLDETRILDLLPKNMKAEIALNIHVDTLAKVKLFQNCETAFLRDLVVKLRSIIILPGDFVCRKGEIGREMFIVKSGKIHVIGGSSGTQILATLGEGSVFGEIALLGVGGMNKRTADVKAGGFVNLFVLNKADLSDVIRDYPEAQEILQRKTRKFMRETIKKARATPSPAATSDDATTLAEETAGVIIKNKSETPQLISTMMKLFPPTTKIGRYLRKGSKMSSEADLSGVDFEENGDIPEEMNVYTSLTSYPPSPYFPASPGHISPELDISIMTGDSSDKRLSPPIEDSTSEMSGLFSDDNSFPSYPKTPISMGGMKEIQIDDGEMKIRNWDSECVSRLTTSSSSSSSKRGNVPIGKVGNPNDDRVARCTSPLPPFLRKEDIPKAMETRRLSLFSNAPLMEDKSASVHARKVRKSCPHFETTDGSENRDDIPIELRPPLYFIEPGVQGFDDEWKGKAKWEEVPIPKTLLEDSSIESEDRTEAAIVKDATSSQVPLQVFVAGRNEARVSPGPGASQALIATRFISRMRGTLERQTEVDVDVDVESVPRKLQKGGEVKGQYSLDIDSD